MLRVYAVSSITSLVFFAILMPIIALFCAVQQDHRALQGFIEGCERIPQPCWYGVVPTRLSIGSSSLQLQQFEVYDTGIVHASTRYTSVDYAASDNTACDMSVYDAMNSEYGVILMDCRDVELGDVMFYLNKPDGLHITNSQIYLLFAGGHIAVVLDSAAIYQGRISPHVPVQEIILSSVSLSSEYAWCGFATRWRYSTPAEGG